MKSEYSVPVVNVYAHCSDVVCCSGTLPGWESEVDPYPSSGPIELPMIPG